MRGKPARTVAESRIQNDVVEYVLTNKAGLSRRDIHGERFVGRHVEDRHDIAATMRRVLAHVGRDRFRWAVGTAFTLAGVTAALAGLHAVGIYVALLGTAAFVGAKELPDVLFTEPAPKQVHTESASPGMGDREVARRLRIHNEREELREEKVEERRKRQERRAKAKRQGGKKF